MSEQVKPASEQKPVAWATTNEDGDYAMLFFDQQEARNYSGDDEPIGLAPVSSGAPQPDYKAQCDALLDFANHIATAPQLSGTGWQEMAQMVVASAKGGAT